jgi:ribosomal subunit interface protein
MIIEYVGRGNLVVDEPVRSYTLEKLRKMLKFLDEPVDVHVALADEGHEQAAEIHVGHRFGSLHARASAPLLLDAINAACDALETQAGRARKKLVERRRRAPRPGAAATPAPAAAEAPGEAVAGEP